MLWMQIWAKIYAVWSFFDSTLTTLWSISTTEKNVEFGSICHKIWTLDSHKNLSNTWWSYRCGDFGQDCSISIAKALEIRQSCTKPSILCIQNAERDLKCAVHRNSTMHINNIYTIWYGMHMKSFGIHGMNKYYFLAYLISNRCLKGILTDSKAKKNS